MALRGLKVVEFAGLAPAPMCGMILSDFGASVIRIDKVRHSMDVDRLARGKRSIAVDLKKPQGIALVRNLCRTSDVLIEPFRSGIMEKLGLGPSVLMQDNPRLIYARLTGFGQDGPYSRLAGHDINYLAISGVLSMLGRKNENPLPPINILGDFAGGGLICSFGVLVALLERNASGKGQVIDANIVEGSAYLSTWLWRSRDLFVWGKPRGENTLDSGSHFYETYRTKDNKYVAVGALEPQFYENLVKGLGLTTDEIGQFSCADEAKARLTSIFAQKTRDEWSAIFDNLDACVTPILELDEAATHHHNKARGSFLEGRNGPEPRPAPLLQRTPANPDLRNPNIGQHTREILLEQGFTNSEIEDLLSGDVVEESTPSSKL